MNIVSRLHSLAPVSLLFAVFTVSTVSAETISVEIKENDTLSKIVAEAYPGSVDRDAIMEMVLERNPEAFRNGDINALILGKQLVLPASDEVVSVTTREPVANNSVTIETESDDQLARVVAERDQLKRQLEQLEIDNTELRDTITQLEAQQVTGSDLQSQLKALQQERETLQADNANALAELKTANQQLTSNQSVTESLRTELAALTEQLAARQAEATTLRSELGVANADNTALQSEIDQIKAAAEKDVTLIAPEPAEKPGSTWWPWLLALLLLPIAWLLGRRSRPVTMQGTALVTKSAVEASVPAQPDPVVPEPLTSEQMAKMGFTHAEAITVPDDPDVAIKLDMARAYLDLRNAKAANDMLQEVIREGGSRQQQEAKEILSFIA